MSQVANLTQQLAGTSPHLAQERATSKAQQVPPFRRTHPTAGTSCPCCCRYPSVAAAATSRLGRPQQNRMNQFRSNHNIVQNVHGHNIRKNSEQSATLIRIVHTAFVLSNGNHTITTASIIRQQRRMPQLRNRTQGQCTDKGRSARHNCYTENAQEEHRGVGAFQPSSCQLTLCALGSDIPDQTHKNRKRLEEISDFKQPG